MKYFNVGHNGNKVPRVCKETPLKISLLASRSLYFLLKMRENILFERNSIQHFFIFLPRYVRVNVLIKTVAKLGLYISAYDDGRADYHDYH